MPAVGPCQRAFSYMCTNCEQELISIAAKGDEQETMDKSLWFISTLFECWVNAFFVCFFYIRAGYFWKFVI